MAKEGQGDSNAQSPRAPEPGATATAPQPTQSEPDFVSTIFEPEVGSPPKADRTADGDEEFIAPPRQPTESETSPDKSGSGAGDQAQPEQPPPQPPTLQSGDPAGESPPQPPELVEVDAGDGKKIQVTPESAQIIEQQKKDYRELQSRQDRDLNEIKARLNEPPKPAEPAEPPTSQEDIWKAFEKSDASLQESIENEGKGFTQKLLAAIEPYQDARDAEVAELKKQVEQLQTTQNTIIRLTRDDLMTTEGTQAVSEAAAKIGIDASKFGDIGAIVRRGNEIALEAGKVLDGAAFWQAAAELQAKATAPPKPNGTTPPAPPAQPPTRPAIPSPNVGGLVQGAPAPPPKAPGVGKVIHKSSGSGTEGL